MFHILCIIQDFLKSTPITHPDYPYLLKAQKELHNLAEKIDRVHKEVNEVYNGDSQSCLQIIQDLIDNLDDVRIQLQIPGFRKHSVIFF